MKNPLKNLTLLLALLPATSMAHSFRGLALGVVGVPAIIVSSALTLFLAFRMSPRNRRWGVLAWVACALPLVWFLHFRLAAVLVERRSLSPVLRPLGIDDELVCALLVPLLLPVMVWLGIRLAIRGLRSRAPA